MTRLSICCSIARSLASVRSLGLVHKALRPRAMLIRSGTGSDYVVYLQDWSYIRELSGATSQLGEDSWQNALYQHPERQGKYAEAVYQPNHDSYSLGVTMLEVLLWKPFVLTADPSSPSPNQICDLYSKTALRIGEGNGGLPQRYEGDPVKLTSRPRATHSIWCEIARSELTEDDTRNLVLTCLNGDVQEMTEVVASIQKMMEARRQVTAGV